METDFVIYVLRLMPFYCLAIFWVMAGALSEKSDITDFLRKPV